MVDVLEANHRDLTGQTTGFTVTNFGADYTISVTEAVTANVAAVLTTLIRDLIARGIVHGTVA